METVDKVLIIPDVHGRTFWKDAVKGREDWKIVFLGDYHDPYSYEGITRHESLENFKEIIEFKRQHEKNITLLIGNHDCPYCFEDGYWICNCRTDVENSLMIAELFSKNKNLFQMVIEIMVGGKKYVFSHAPITKKWVKDNNIDIVEDIIAYLNNGFLADDEKFRQSLCNVGWYRGGYFNGSIVWADLRELEFDHEELFLDDYAIFGHTQLDKNPVVRNNYACLDCRKAFILNEKGEITELDGTVVPKI